jgi:cell filamentation protein
MPESLDPYLYPGTDVLRNLPGLHDLEQLAAFEANVCSARLIQLGVDPMKGKFDVTHLKSIHRFIFQDVFSWAGQFRTVNISKDGQLFGLPRFLEPALSVVFNKLAAEEHLAGLDREAFAERAGYYLGEVNAVHPFREGNGRAQREFFRELALGSGHRILWSRITSQQIMTEASIQSFRYGRSQGLADLIWECILPK